MRNHFEPRSAVFACAILLSLCGCKADRAGRGRTPSQRGSLPVVSLADAGLDEKRLESFAEAVGGSGAVIRQDSVAFIWGNPKRPLDVASASKAVYAHLVFKAVEEGRIPSLDQPVVEWIPELARLNPALGHKDSRITWRHLINQTSCYGVTEEPGAAFDYNDYQTGLLWILLFHKVYDAAAADDCREVLRDALFDPIGTENDPSFRPMASNEVLHHLIISPLDFARIGLVYLHDGRWGDQQIISVGHVNRIRTAPLPPDFPRTAGRAAEMLSGAPSYGGGKNQDDHLGSYSHMWWLNKRDRDGALLFPSVPEDAFAAIGLGGKKVLMVIPSLDMVVSWNTERLAPASLSVFGRKQMDAVLKILCSAVK